MNTLNDIRDALDRGLEVCWGNESYEVHYVDQFEHCNDYSLKDGKLIRITCKSNYFGSLINESDIGSCFLKLPTGINKGDN